MPVVEHLDDDKDNNALDNLAWSVQKDNVHRAIENGVFSFDGLDVSRAEAKRKANRYAAIAKEMIEHRWTYKEAAAVFGRSRSAVFYAVGRL